MRIFKEITLEELEEIKKVDPNWEKHIFLDEEEIETVIKTQDLKEIYNED